MTQYQIQELEKWYRLAVQLAVNPAGTGAPCEAGCGRLGSEAAHVVRRSQEPGIRWKYEPRWSAWLCHVCHSETELLPAEELLRRLGHRPEKVRRLRRYLEVHDRVKCRSVSFAFMRDYLKRCVKRLQADWATAYCEGA